MKVAKNWYERNHTGKGISFLFGLIGLILTLTLSGIGHQMAYSQNLSYEIDACRDGYVWREAIPNDHVCVIPESREQARQDNALRDSRISSTDHTYGPDTCIIGYVWREVVPSDHTCVLPDIRTQTQVENSQAENNRVVSSISSVPHNPDFPQFLGISETLTDEAATSDALNNALQELRGWDESYQDVQPNELNYQLVSTGEGQQGGKPVRWAIIELVRTLYPPCPEPCIIRPIQGCHYLKDPRISLGSCV